MTDPTDADIAAMPHVADAALAATFHWGVSEESRLYRECPTAFWLAPDAYAALTTPEVAGRKMPEKPEAVVTDVTATGVRGAITSAALVAGPVFLSALGLIQETGGTPISAIVRSVWLGLMSAPLSIPVGALAALIPAIIGVCVLSMLGLKHPLARRRSLWASTGAGMGLIIAAAFDAGMTTIPLVLTSIACATVARKAIDWPDPDPA